MRLGKGVGVLAKNIGSASPSYVLEDRGDDEFIHPFKVTAFKDGTNIKVQVRAGTVNNIVPEWTGGAGGKLDSYPVPSLSFTASDGTWYVYLIATAGSPPVFFPDDLKVQVDDTFPADSDNNGHLLIATFNVSGGSVASINQFVYASQVLVRAKPGTADALWSWSSR